MPSKLHKILLTLTCGLLAFPASAATLESQTTAAKDSLSYSYARLYDLKYQFVALPGASTSHLHFHLRLQPRQEDLPPLTAYIDWPRQRVELESDPVLNFLQLPLSPQLRQENPRVITNWPKDSAALGLAMEISVPDGKPISPAELLKGMQQANAAISTRSRRPASLTPQAVGVTLRAIPGTQLKVTLVGMDGGEHTMNSEDETINLQAADLESAAELRIEGQLLIIFPWFG